MEWGNSVPEVNLVRKIFMNYPNQQIRPIFNIVWLFFFSTSNLEEVKSQNMTMGCLNIKVHFI